MRSMRRGVSHAIVCDLSPNGIVVEGNVDVVEFVKDGQAFVYFVDACVFAICEVGDLRMKWHRVSSGVRKVRNFVSGLHFCEFCEELGG